MCTMDIVFRLFFRVSHIVCQLLSASPAAWKARATKSNVTSASLKSQRTRMMMVRIRSASLFPFVQFCSMWMQVKLDETRYLPSEKGTWENTRMAPSHCVWMTFQSVLSRCSKAHIFSGTRSTNTFKTRQCEQCNTLQCLLELLIQTVCMSCNIWRSWKLGRRLQVILLSALGCPS